MRLLHRAALPLLAALALIVGPACAQSNPKIAPPPDLPNIVPQSAITYADGSGNPVVVSSTNPLPVTGGTGGGGGSGTQYTEDVAAPVDPVGTIVAARRRDTLTTTEVSADGDIIAVNATSKGELVVRDADAVSTLGTINTKLPASIGAKASSASLPVVLATDQATLPVSAASLPLPAGAATSANQTTGNTSLGNIDADIGAPADVACANAGSSCSAIAVLKGLLSAMLDTGTASPVSQSGTWTVAPKLSTGSNTSVTTAATGTNFTAFASLSCAQLTLVNNTGTTVEFRQGAAGVAVPVFDKTAFTIFGLSNANSIDVRRTDTSNTQVTVQARCEN